MENHDSASAEARERIELHRRALAPVPRWHMLALIGGALAFSVSRLNDGIDLGDEGFMAACASRVMDGQVPHRDFYSLQGPLSSVILAGWSTLVGLSFLKLRVLGALVHTCMVLLTYLIARRLASAHWALAAGAVAILVGLPHMRFAPLPVWMGLCLSMLAVWLALRSWIDGERRIAYLSGMVGAIGMLVRHDQGAYMLVAILMLALVMRSWPAAVSRRASFKLGHWIAGALTVGVPSFVAAWLLGALPAMWDQLVLFPLTRYHATSGLPFPMLGQDGPTGSLLAFVLFRLTPLAALITLALVAWSYCKGERSVHSRVGFFLGCWSLCMFTLVMFRSDLAHLVLTMHPMLVLLAWLAAFMERRFASRPGIRKTLWAGGIAGFGLLAAVAWHVLLLAPERSPLPIESPFAGVKDRDAEQVNAVVRAIAAATNAGDAILVLPYHPAYYVLADRRNPTAWGYHWPGDRTEEELRQLIAQAARDAPAAVVIFNRDSTVTYLAPVVQWVEENYVPVDVAADKVIYRPRTPQGYLRGHAAP